MGHSAHEKSKPSSASLPMSCLPKQLVKLPSSSISQACVVHGMGHHSNQVLCLSSLLVVLQSCEACCCGPKRLQHAAHNIQSALSVVPLGRLPCARTLHHYLADSQQLDCQILAVTLCKLLSLGYPGEQGLHTQAFCRSNLGREDVLVPVRICFQVSRASICQEGLSQQQLRP